MVVFEEKGLAVFETERRVTRGGGCGQCVVTFTWLTTAELLEKTYLVRLLLMPRHTSHVTRHTSHVTRHTSHVTRHSTRRSQSKGLVMAVDVLNRVDHAVHGHNR